jgi:hypothetical protein
MRVCCHRKPETKQKDAKTKQKETKKSEGHPPKASFG